MNDDRRDDHAELHEWAGAYALGSLDRHDRRTFERHLDVCERCADEVNAFAPIPGLLAHVELDDLRGTSPETAAAISRRAIDEGHVLRSSRGRWRATALTIAAAGVLVASAAIVVQLVDDDPPAQTVVAATVTSSQATTSAITTSERQWGTEITVHAVGLPSRSTYTLWGIDRSGTWSIAATWGPTPTGGAKITGATSLPTASLDRIVVTSGDRSDVLIDSMV